jgi:peptidoglycan hydrolase-like protein with peptidoglycan-binding domain
MSKTWIEVASGQSGRLANTVQFLLGARGYDVIVDGTVDPQTTSAIKAFQTDNGLTADGVVGNQTWPALIMEVAQGSKGDAVCALQDQLRYRNLAQCRNLAVDGKFGPLTEAAVRAFQLYVRDNQASRVDVPVQIDGVAGVNTWYTLVIGLGPLQE